MSPPARTATCAMMTGAAGAFFGSLFVIRENMPLHDLTGGQYLGSPNNPPASYIWEIFPDELGSNDGLQQRD